MTGRRCILLIFALVWSLLSGAQEARKVENLPKFDLATKHFGFYLSGNQMFFVVKPAEGFQYKTWNKDQIPDLVGDSARVYGIEPAPIPGFSIGIVSNLRLGEFFDLRFLPGLQFGERKLTYSILLFNKGDSSLVTIPKNINSTFIDFPLYIKYKSKRDGNFRAFVTGGLSYKIDLASSTKDKAENPSNVVVKLTKHDFTGDLGVGFDFYTVYFKFAVEVKMSYGLNDMIFREGNIYSDSMGKLSTKMFQISFTFE
ncbi:MAG: porin family protein [Bacteroidales bacterium]